MRLLLLGEKRILLTNLPKIYAGIFWLTDENNNNLLKVEPRDTKWIIKSNKDIKLFAEQEQETKYNEEEKKEFVVNYLDELELVPNQIYNFININNETTYKVYCDENYDNNLKQYMFSLDTFDNFIIGNNNKKSLQTSKEVDINCQINSFAKNQLEITYQNGYFFIKNLNTRINMYINNYAFEDKKILDGDLIFIDGLKLCLVGDILLINHPDLTEMEPTKFYLRELPVMADYDFSKMPEEDLQVFTKDDYFQRPPRITKIIETKEIEIDDVPNTNKSDEIPFFFTLGTMLTMAIMSVMTGLTALSKISSGESTVKEQMPQLVICISMLIGMLVFPILRQIYTKHTKKRKERIRQKTYRAYLSTKKQEILDEIKEQRQILLENNLSPNDCTDVILNRKRNLWERKIEHADFLNVRVGLGTLKPKITIKAPEKHFSIEKDDLADEMFKTVDALQDMENVPIVIDLKEKLCSAFIGEFSLTSKVIDNILLQLLTCQSYDALRIVVFTDINKKYVWDKYKNVPYFWDDAKNLRFIGSNQEDILQISSYLTEEYNRRLEFNSPKESSSNKQKDFHDFKPYYLIITDTIESLENVGIIPTILNHTKNLGFSLLINTNNIDSLPNECSLFVNIEKYNCAIYEQELIANHQISFKPDEEAIDLEKSLIKLSNIPVDIADGKYLLPESYSFMELYDIGSVEQFNSINRWKQNNPITSLSAPIGVNEQGETFKLDIHEKYHGPHGLVAGMTGSGKSEWLITYILSMAINYHPDEVQFVLIDYKGGGLAGVFENRETGFKLPHLAGTITNLDIVEINRALASIQSELKRRQTMFNEARDTLNEATIDIYKYQRLYREGKVKEPISHLIIISDEFAELKSQQPEFMKELISTARIGRSLGVHLILSTQKPSGVVDEQIWSNAKFRVCLKVQEKADSDEMIKRPDAAMLKEPGRFYLQVGFDEYFAKGQVAYAGSPYYETDKRKVIVDNSIEFINELGYCYKVIDNKKQTVEVVHKGEELPNILNYIKETANSIETHVKQLWLNRIPDVIYHDDLKVKYNFTKQNFILEPIIGEYDAPEIQKQGLLTLPLTKEGHAIIYGISGSGKENLLCNILYSLISFYTVAEVNIYILDFGAEILRAFKSAPQVGEFITTDSTEKIVNLFKFLLKTLEERKTLFQDYNGNIETYNTQSGKTVPNILVIINNIDNFQELYPDFVDIITQISRDCAKYGIIFILTTNGIGNVRMRTAQNFPIQFTLQLKDKTDYVNVLGQTGGIIPSKIKGRGLYKLNKVYEFQSAYVTDESKQIDFIKAFCQKLKESTNERAQKIAILPKVVDFDFVDDFITLLDQVPIGVYKNNLEVAKFDFITKGFTMISSQFSDNMLSFTDSLLTLLANYKNLNVFVIDTQKTIENLPPQIKLFNNNFDNLVIELNKFVSSFNLSNINNYNNNLFIFYGINEFYSSLSSENKIEIYKIFTAINKISKINIILIDSVNNLKKLEYVDWYKECVNNTRGIWLGSGITEQYSIKITKVTKELKQEIPEGFGFVVEKGVPMLTKFIDFKGSVQDENEQQNIN